MNDYLPFNIQEINEPALDKTALEAFRFTKIGNKQRIRKKNMMIKSENIT